MIRPLVDGWRRSEEDVQRLVLEDLLYFFPGSCAMLSAFIDESGTGDHEPAMCVAGLLYSREEVRTLDEGWKQALDSAGVRFFHSKEAAHLQGEFKKVTREVQHELHRRLIELISKHACGGSVAFITSEKDFARYKKLHGWKLSRYTTCAYACIAVLVGIAQKRAELIDFTIESGHKHMGELDSLLSGMERAGLPITHIFRDKNLRPLQTADIWAYESWKRIREQFKSTARDMRKSLAAIIEGVPNLQVVSLNNESLPVLFKQVEDWLKPRS